MRKRAKNTTRQTLKLFWQFSRPNPYLFWYATLGSIAAAAVTSVIPPLIIAKGFDKLQYLSARNLPITAQSLMPYILVFIAANFVSLILWRTEAWAAWIYQIKSMKRIRDYIFEHLQTMDIGFYNDRFGGALVSQVNKFTSAYESFSASFTWNIIPGLTLFFGSLIILFFKAPLYAAVFLLIAIVHTVIMTFLMNRQMPFNRRLSTSESDTTAKLADSITNISTVKAFAGEDQEIEIFEEQSADSRDKYLELMSVQLRNEVVGHTGTSIMDAAAFSMGLLGVIYLNAPIGTLYLIVTYTLNLSQRLWEFMFILKRINRDFGNAADMTEILQMQTAIKDVENPEDSRIKHGKVEFKDVTFAYKDNAEESLFNKLNLTIKPGEKIGLIGHSGGGKTTITKLLLRFMDIDGGQILIDGQDIASIRQQDLRSHIAYVPQEPMLFHRSLSRNISYGSPGASQKEVETVAKLANAHEFISGLSDGYGTLVGERSVKLSGGQRQRVAIARAMIKNAPILVLDEATSALDSESEKLIQDALWKLMEGRTSIVIAHRLSTIQKMDRIIVLDDGKIVEEGTHRQLLGKKGTYAKLWAHQSGGFLED